MEPRKVEMVCNFLNDFVHNNKCFENFTTKLYDPFNNGVFLG